MTWGIIILGHGSKRPEAVAGMLAVGNAIKQKLANVAVDTAFMAHAAPGIEETVAALAKKGVTDIIVATCFLFEGVHVLEDIPRILEQLQDEYQNKIRFTCTSSLGGDQRLVDMMIDKIREVS